ncbi:AAA family ATPase [Subsaximicrobium wynnwilliamsii]|uniref:AAA family ATPase n=1 Tax=Subsaximicrobium wynnwilliamsii TaxID=291179 RepID=A0A5C6ZK84_9FLAO|nr:AAA family ATPase [Subsaximicrobium wynnwilliamsii]TXD84530.1 AAA family ATPase [Subsaximicrobium wynnwilliamsii]TXD90212.1 AAA family ATPase [Subsaximicrobium wynnwilliamsii]TXE04263.1 AAA family ATPase [Subsaximicrobium wynnwilliamsii]
MKILLFGASGCGTTTLGREIQKSTDFVHLDVDDYYWKKSETPFQEKIPLKERNKNLKKDFETFQNVIVSGSMVSWGKEWETAFDLVVFIRLENDERMKRLGERERKRYGKKLYRDKNVQQSSKAFLEWANQYENPNFNGRSLKTHNDWMKSIDCKVLKMDGETKLEHKVEIIIKEIKIL